MRIFFILVLTFYVILNSIEISLCISPKTRDFLANFGISNEHEHDQVSSSHFERLPDSIPIPDISRDGPSASFFDAQHSPASSLLPARPHSPLRSPSPEELPQRERSLSPPARYTAPLTRLPSADGNEYGLEHLPFIRLTPTKNLQLHFELRKYVFPENERIKVITEPKVFAAVPPQEQIVLSTSDGDVFAILSSSDTLAGIYKHFGTLQANKRSKINMESGRVTRLTLNETDEVPVGPRRPISHYFRIEYVNHSNGSTSPAEPGPSARSRSLYALPFSKVLGYGLDQLPFMRLRYKENLHRIFVFRKYTFTADKQIRMLAGQGDYRPMPVQEQIVLSTFGGDVFAVLDSSNTFAGIYARNPRYQRERRAKINIESGTIIFLTADEIRETPVGPRYQHFIVNLVKPNPQHH